jgi:hypothetical protein
MFCQETNRLWLQSKEASEGIQLGEVQEDAGKALPVRQSYYSLLLYRLRGEKRNELDSVRWHLCQVLARLVQGVPPMPG